jgi:hypothetical protein
MGKGIIIVVAILAIVGIGGYLVMSWSYTNQHIELKNGVTAQQTVCAAHFDKMWKVLQQMAQVPDAAKDAFKEMYQPLIEGRYKDSNLLMKWIQEQNPDFDFKLFENVQRAIESERASFFDDQKILIDKQMADKNLVQKVPGRWFIDPADTAAITIITSAKTEDAYRTGQENDIGLFPKKQ